MLLGNKNCHKNDDLMFVVLHTFFVLFSSVSTLLNNNFKQIYICTERNATKELNLSVFCLHVCHSAYLCANSFIRFFWFSFQIYKKAHENKNVLNTAIFEATWKMPKWPLKILNEFLSIFYMQWFHILIASQAIWVNKKKWTIHDSSILNECPKTI